MAKKQNLKSDKFIETVGNVTKFIIKEKEKSFWAGIAVLIIIIISIYFASQSKQVNPQANILYLEGMGLFSTGRFEQAENMFKTITQQFPNTNTSRRSIYYLGYICYLTKRFDEAIEHFEKYLSKERKDFILVPSALMGLGNSKEGLKDYEGALKTYEKIIKDYAGSPIYLQAKLAAGRVKGLLGDYEGARKDLEEVIGDRKAGALAEEAKFYLGYLAPK